MKKMFKKFAVVSIAGMMACCTSLTAFAAYGKDTASQLTESADNADHSTTDSFYLIKDYDSKNPTEVAPLSSSPAETFTYTITPYAVWNAGYTYNNGTATKISTTNMPLLFTETTNPAADRSLTIQQNASKNDAKYEISDDKENTGDKKTEIKLPTYETVGDYWYKVQETIGTTTGVFYGTNSVNLTTDETASNGGHSATYYIHVQVTESSTTQGTSSLVQNVTLHTTAPDPATYKTDADYNTYVQGNQGEFYKNNANSTHKVNAIENRYYAGDLKITKKVTGNAGDKDKYFKVTVTFTKPAGTIVNSDITYNAVLLNETTNTYMATDCVVKGQYYAEDKNATTIKWSNTSNSAGTATCVFYVKDNDTVTFSNIPYGINYKIIEEQPADDNDYRNEITFSEPKDTESPKFGDVPLIKDTDSAAMSDAAGFNKFAEGSISDPHDAVVIENKKETAIDIGVILSNAPYIALLVLAAGAGVLLICRRKRHIED